MAGCGSSGGEAVVSTRPTDVATTMTVPPETTTSAPTVVVNEAEPPTTADGPATIPTNSVARSTVPVVVEERYVPGTWWALGDCESGNTNADTGNGYYGYFQWSAATWRGMGHAGLPTDHGYDYQLAASVELQATYGWGQWPACARKLGLL